MYCIVLKEWSLLPNALRPYKVYCAPPNLGNTSPPAGLVLWIFTSWKIHRSQPGLNPRTLDLEANTLPQDHRGRQPIYLQSFNNKPAFFLLFQCKDNKIRIKFNLWFTAQGSHTSELDFYKWPVVGSTIRQCDWDYAAPSLIMSTFLFRSASLNQAATYFFSRGWVDNIPVLIHI